MKTELNYTQLNNREDINKFSFKTTDDIEPFKGIIGQERAVKAFEFGLNVKMKGYNIYVSGPCGSGKTTYAKLSAKEKAKNEAVPYDWCYVYNFDDPRSPLSLRFEPGIGRQFRDDMNELVSFFKTELTKAFTSEDYDKEKSDLSRTYDDKRDELIKKLDSVASENSFALKTSNSGIIFQPIIDNVLITEENYDSLDEDVKNGINERLESMQDVVNSIMRDIKNIDKEYRQKMDDLDYKIGMFAIGHYVSALQEKYQYSERVIKYLESVQEDVLENIDQFSEQEPDEEDPVAALLPKLGGTKNDDATLKYRVNLIVDNSKTEGAPVIVDYNPTYYNLVGEVEYDNEYGNLTTDFMKIKPGLMHRANGGYLIIQAQDLLSNVQAWEAFRRIIKTKEITIENLRDQVGAIAVTTLKPEPIPSDVKVILVGGAYYYELLRGYDEDFSKLFKIRADFDYEMDRNDENIFKIAGFISKFCDNEKTLPFDSSAVASVIEYSSRSVESQKKLSTRFNLIAEILAESATWAQLDNAEIVTAEYVKKAEEEKAYRLSMYQEKMNELLDNNTIMIATDGYCVGKINGLAVLDMGDYSFGSPTRITATTYMGKSGIVNIEKEAEMSGPTHNKGVQIITGYLGRMYAQKMPLSLSCRIAFEQNYNGIDGDSASSTELYCILSSLSEIPVNQSLAVTGSVNQCGEIQAIGGVTHKIEGYFDLCSRRGLTGKQGVVIPESNVNDLVLKDDVIEAVKNGMFHIYSISTIDEGIELLLGTEAGIMDENGDYPPESVHGKVMAKLKKFNEYNED
ncbi:Lon protease family protein [Anaerotignum sp. MSJ-24]|uniref:Lon protease family protein n=1 Tax=Anaerotignum sp. MSJ-24 TaxID=2841521 RepID=UPI002ED03B26